MSITDRKKLRVSETDMGHILSQVNPKANPYNLDRKVTDAVADIRGSGPKTLTDLDTDLANIRADLPVRIARTVTLVQKTGAVDNGTAIVHTVTNGKTFYLTAATARISVYAAGGALSGFLAIRNGSDTFVTEIIGLNCAEAVAGDFGSISFPVPVPIAAGYDIYVYASAKATCRGNIWGWEE